MRELIIHSLVATLPASITLIGVQAAPSCPRRAAIGIGADSNVSASGTLFGVAQEVDIGDGVAVDYARVFGGSYQSLAGGAGGALNGANSTLQRLGLLDRWRRRARGRAHLWPAARPRFPANSPSSGCNDGTDQTKAGEDPLTRHLMAQGCHFTDEQRAGFRRHFSDVTFSILAANVGLTLETIHNWDLTNPNSANVTQIRFDVLSPASSPDPDLERPHGQRTARHCQFPGYSLQP